MIPCDLATPSVVRVSAMGHVDTQTTPVNHMFQINDSAYDHSCFICFPIFINSNNCSPDLSTSSVVSLEKNRPAAINSRAQCPPWPTFGHRSRCLHGTRETSGRRGGRPKKVFATLSDEIYQRYSGKIHVGLRCFNSIVCCLTSMFTTEQHVSKLRSYVDLLENTWSIINNPHFPYVFPPFSIVSSRFFQTFTNITQQCPLIILTIVIPHDPNLFPYVFL